uniref:Reverse transcriptase domain-containing protein n=1 Tax=Arundo donax TaxID=35708 RepID=A0A0A9GKK0_ARUDO
MKHLAGIFGCKIGTLPFTYLGLPVVTTKPRVDDHAPLINRMERRLSAVASFLATSGRLTLVNLALSSLPTYTMCTLLLPITVTENIDRARRNCLWRGSDVNAKGKPLVAWKKVYRPKSKGGLGVVDLKSQNEALLVKHLHKFYNKMDLPWVNLIWNTHYTDS